MARKPTVKRKDIDSARRLALSAGELHREGVQQILASYDKAKGNPFRAMGYGLKELVVKKVITKNDSNQLLKMARALYAGRSTKKMHAKFVEIFEDLKADQRSSPAALAIAGIAVDSIQGALDQPIAMAQSVVQADAVGAAAGAGAAANVGGAQDIVVGAAVGGVGSSGMAWIKSKK